MTEVARPPRWLGQHEADITAFLAKEGEANALVELAEQLGGVGHWRIMLPAYTISWSAEVYRIHGVTPDQYMPDLATAIGFYHPDDRELVQAAVAAAAHDGQPFEFSTRLVRADGELRHVKCRGVAIAGPDDVPALIFGVFIDVTDQQKIEEVLHETNLKLEQMAYVDALTLLPNRRQFDEILEREWRRAIREETPLSLVMLDIDKFKAFNDLYGHLAGDVCLHAVATAIAPMLHRPGDLLARYGGEEFALILPVTEAVGAEAIAQRLRAAIAALGLIHAGNPSGGGVVTASLGVSTAHPQLGTVHNAWLDLIAEADGLLYEAKRTGRNRVVSPTSILGTGAAPLAANEEARLSALAVYEQAGATRRTAEMDRIAKLAAKLMSVSIGLVSLVGETNNVSLGISDLRVWKYRSRYIVLCPYHLGDEPFVVPDATRDVRFDENPVVTGDFRLRYYAGAPIISVTTGHRLGALCVIDKSPRAETTPAERALLTDLAKMAAELIEENMASSSTT